MVFAVVVTPRMSVDTFPELTPPVLVVGTMASGLGPKDVEKTLSWRIEKYVSATPGVDHVQSVSRNNLSIVYVWLKWGTDLNAAQTLVQQQAAFAMAAVPKSLGVLPPFVLQYDPSNAPVVQVAVTGGGLSGPQLYDYALNNIEPVLEGISGVASASINGGRQRQINVVVDPVKAQARGITSADVAAAVHDSNALLPSGEFISSKFDANVYTNAVPPQVAAIGDAVVKMHGAAPVLIRDVARIEDGGAPETQAVSVGGQNAVYLNVLRVPGGNTLEIVDAVKARIHALGGLPAGLRVVPVFDQSTFVRTTYDGLKKEVLQALVLIAIVILLFLQSTRGTLIVSVAIPLSFAITLIVLYATGQTLNAFTLGGLTLAMGRLVDDAVVVLESIHRHQRMGLGIAEAALRGTNAVALPVLASTLTTMAVLLPVLLLAGLAQKLFAPLALTVAVAMIASYFVSVCVTPVACRYFLGHTQHGRLGARVEAGIDARGRSLCGAAGARAAVPRAPSARRRRCSSSPAPGRASRLPSTFFPEIDESMERIYVRLAPGTSLTESAALIDRIGNDLQRQLGTDIAPLVLTNVGSPNNARSAMTSPNEGPHMGFIRLALVDPEQRKESQREIADRIRGILTRDYPGVEFLQWPGGLVASVFANGYIAPVVIEVRGDNLEALDAEAKAVAEVAATVPGVRDICSSLEMDYPEIRVETDRGKAGLVGVTAARRGADDAGGDARQHQHAQRLDRLRQRPVVLRRHVLRRRGGRRHRTRSAQLPVRVGADGQAGPARRLRHRCGARSGRSPSSAISCSARPTSTCRPRGATSAASRAISSGRWQPIRGRATIKFGFVGQVDLMRTTFSGLGLALGLAVMVVFMIMASQFKSLRLPFVMLFTIPVSLVGIVLALMAAGQGFSITALMGILMVIGIAVSNGILLVDDANRRFSEGCREDRRGRRRRPLALRPHRDDQPGHRHRPHPDGARPRARLGGQPAAGARGGRRPDLVDDPVAVPRARDVRPHRREDGKRRCSSNSR